MSVLTFPDKISTWEQLEELLIIDKDIVEDLLRKTNDEIHRAHAKHGDESMVSPGGDVGRRLGILGEEFGEVCTATTYDRGDPEELYKELIQLAAMALSWAHVLDFQKSTIQPHAE